MTDRDTAADPEPSRRRLLAQEESSHATGIAGASVIEDAGLF